MAQSDETSGKSYWEAIEPIWKSVSIYDGPEIFLDTFSKLPEPIGHLFAAHWCSSEVCNGGLLQFFGNPTGVLAPEAVEGLKAIGLAETAAVVVQAIAYFGPNYARDQGVRLDALIATGVTCDNDEPGPFEDLDDRFLELIDEESGGFWLAANRYAEEFA